MTGTRKWPVWSIWVLLAGMSVFGVLLAEGLAPAKVATTTAIVLAAIKIHLVFDHYMELRWHHRPLRLMLAAWLAAVTLILLGGYWAG